jgi:hypothetical protein
MQEREHSRVNEDTRNDYEVGEENAGGVLFSLRVFPKVSLRDDERAVHHRRYRGRRGGTERVESDSSLCGFSVSSASLSVVNHIDQLAQD